MSTPEPFDLFISDTIMAGMTDGQTIQQVQMGGIDMKTILYRGYSECWISDRSTNTRGVNALALQPFDRKQPAVTVPAGLEACA